MAHLKLKLETVENVPTLHIILFFFFFMCVLPTVIPGDETETAYMLRLMDAMTPTPSNWSNKTDICTWSGVMCDYGHVLRIDLSSMSLNGTLPSGLNDSLTALNILFLQNNSLSGHFPSLANLIELHEVDITNNNFTSIPHGCFHGLVGLQSLTLRDNINLAPWKFPTDLIDSSALIILDLTATNLMGTLPDIFHSFPNLQSVDLSYNSLSGILPESFARAKIESLYLNDQRYDKFSGTLNVLSSMTSLFGVGLQGNRFQGPIPDLSNCSQLGYLLLNDNCLTGVVPASLMNHSRLVNVSLYNNWLQGPLPPIFNKQVSVNFGVNTTNGFCLDHAGPCDPRVTTLLEIAQAFGYPLLLARTWRGNDPCKGWNFVTCDESIIRTVNLSNLSLTGKISHEFGNLTGLWHLYLDGNNLQGPIPESLVKLPQLEVVDVSSIRKHSQILI